MDAVAIVVTTGSGCVPVPAAQLSAPPPGLAMPGQAPANP